MALPVMPVTWSLDGISFNSGDDVNGWSYLVSVKGWKDGSPPRSTLQDRPWSNGSFRSSNYRGPRVVEMEGIAQASTRVSREALANRLSGLCYDPALLYPVVCAERSQTLSAMVELSGKVGITELPDGMTLKINILLVASDPRKYSTAVKSAFTALAQAAVGGVAWDGPGPAVTGVQWDGPGPAVTGVVWQLSSGAAGIIALDNAGGASAPILFTITAPVTGTLITPTITNAATGATIAYSGTLIPGDVLTINTGTGLALLNGNSVGALFSRYEMFELPPRATQSVQFSAGGPADTASLLAQWSDTY